VSVLDRFRLDGRTALVTGCKRGIGQAMAVALAEAGADVIGVSRTLEPECSDVGRQVLAAGRRFQGYTCDFASRPAVYGFLEQLAANQSLPDILINNAATILRSPAAEHSDAYWDEVIETNLNAQWVLTRDIGKRMVERGSGKIIFIASLLSFQGGINVPGYAASKGAIAQLTKALSNEWAAHGVQVNAIAPGYVETDNTAALRVDSVRSSAILSRIPAGRWGRPEDFAGAAVYLASTASDYVNGSVLVIDGGWMGR
jgi:2-deoxy-D-gluconate 3-dehydrogenase